MNSPENIQPPAEPRPTLTYQTRFALVFGAWILVALVMTIDEPKLLLMTWAFPIFTVPGYLVFYLNANDGSGFWFGIVIGWVYYFFLTRWTLYAQRRRVFIWLFLFLALSLILNCAGCHSMTHLHINC